MILGFAHITKNVRYARGAPAVANAPEKWPLMARQAVLHWLTLSKHPLLGPKEEVVEYNTGVVEQPGPGRLSLATGKVVLHCRDAEAESAFFVSGHLAVDTPMRWLECNSLVPDWSEKFYPVSRPDVPIDLPLDIEGYAALAFYSTNVEADRDHLLKHGGRTPTEPFTVTLDRKMKIVMLRSPEGTIIELIQVLK